MTAKYEKFILNVILRNKNDIKILTRTKYFEKSHCK